MFKKLIAGFCAAVLVTTQVPAYVYAATPSNADPVAMSSNVSPDVRFTGFDMLRTNVDELDDLDNLVATSSNADGLNIYYDDDIGYYYYTPDDIEADRSGPVSDSPKTRAFVSSSPKDYGNSVTNWNGVRIQFTYYPSGSNSSEFFTVFANDSGVFYLDKGVIENVMGDDYYCTTLTVWLDNNSMPSVSGNYNFGFYVPNIGFTTNDTASFFDYVSIRSRRGVSNSSAIWSPYYRVDYAFSSNGALSFNLDYEVTSVEQRVYIDFRVKENWTLDDMNFEYWPSGESGNYSLVIAPNINFSPTDNEPVAGGISYSSGDAAIDTAQNSSIIASNTASIGDTLKELIVHISDQLAALWDQMYNYMHVPHLANDDRNTDRIINKLGEDLNVEIQNQDSNADEIIQNQDKNTGIIDDAIEEHGNFIIEGLKGLFIPDDMFFKSYFDDLYGWFSDRFGFLSFPLDLLVELVNLFTDESGFDCVLTLPSFSIMDEQLWPDMSFNLTDFLETNFAFLLTAMRTVTSIGLIGMFIRLCEDKYEEVMRN